MHRSLCADIGWVDARSCRACLRAASAEELEDFIDMRQPMETADSKICNFLQCFNLYTQLNVNQAELSSSDATHEDYQLYRYLCSHCREELQRTHAFITKAQHNHGVLQAQLTQLKCDASEKTEDSHETVEALMDYELLEVDHKESHELQEECGTAVLNGKTHISREPGLAEMLAANLDDVEPAKSPSNESATSRSDKENVDEFISVERVYHDEQEDSLHADSHLSGDETKGSSYMIKLEDVDTETDAEDYVAAQRQHFFEFKCEYCTAKFDFERDLMQHYENDHDDANLHFPCELCTRRFVNKHALRLHKRQIHQQCEYIDCPQCGRIVLKTFYGVHLKRHNRKTKFLCSQCPNTFTTRSTLTNHMQLHSEKRDRNFECIDCERKFFTVETLQRHQSTHQDRVERDTYECTICAKTFLRKSSLRLHMHLHRGETIGCTHCGKQFVRRKDLEIHVRFHTGDFPYACSFCDKKFAIKGHLTYHEKRHSGVRYKCSQCEKTFINLSGLRQHSFEHTGMPLVCNICLRGFPTQFKMRRHVRSVHYQLFEATGYSDRQAEQYVTRQAAQKLDKKRNDGAAEPEHGAEMIEMLEEHVADIPKNLLLV